MPAFLIPLIAAAASAAAAKSGGKSSSAADYLKKIPVPKAEDLQLQLEQLVQTGQLRPEDLQTILQGPSAYETISEDPRLRGEQTDVIGRLREIADAGGLDAQARLGLEDALDTQRTETRGQLGAIGANARARGIGGSDLEYLNRMIAAQGASQSASRAALEQAAIGQQRRDAALTQGANLAGNVRQADYNVASGRANAQDAIARYNAANMQNVAQQNVTARNQAQAANLGERQRVSDTNVGIRNDQQTQNTLTTPLQIYGLRTGQATQLGSLAQTQQQADAARNQQLASMIAAGAQAYAASDERVKEDVDPQGVDSEAILRDLSSATWRYKGDDQTHAGPMAQEFEKGPLGGYVGETPDGVKTVDYGGMGFESGEQGGLFMSLLADVSRRIDELAHAKGTRNAG